MINEGLMLHPQFGPLVFAQIGLARFAHDPVAASNYCTAVLDRKDAPRWMQEQAFVTLLEVFADADQIEGALRRIESGAESVTDPTLRDRLMALKMKIYARHSMVGKETPQGERIFVREVVDYYLPGEAVSDEDPVVTAEVLDWMCREDEALAVLAAHIETAPSDWEARKTMALILLKADRSEEAVACAKEFTEVSPWRAESFDCLEYVAEKAGLADVAREAKRRGNAVFDREKVLFDNLRTALEAS